VLRELRGGEDTDNELPARAVKPQSRPGEIYELGRHRLACGDATDSDLVGELLAGVELALLIADPPYGVELDHGWRDGVRQPAGSARAGQLLGDDRADWRQALLMSRRATTDTAAQGSGWSSPTSRRTVGQSEDRSSATPVQ
jgi:hypothetical protein